MREYLAKFFRTVVKAPRAVVVEVPEPPAGSVA
jgi:hypothetical protein